MIHSEASNQNRKKSVAAFRSIIVATIGSTALLAAMSTTATTNASASGYSAGAQQSAPANADVISVGYLA